MSDAQYHFASCLKEHRNAKGPDGLICYVSADIYRELQKACAANCTQRQFELVAAGMKWEQAKEEK